MIKIQKRQNLTTKPWSGGLTTQLGIFPNEAQYGTDKFYWRLSTATIEGCESSQFTLLPGIRRHLMILEGQLSLSLDGQSYTLSETEKITFLGDQHVVGKGNGRVVDFNLMLAENFDGLLQFEQVDQKVTLASLGDFMGIYVIGGQMEYESSLIQAGDFLLCEEETSLTLVGTGNIVVAHIWE